MRRIGVIFWGGPDDRGALAFASYMAEREGVTITVHRYVPTTNDGQSEEDNRMDNDGILEFKFRTIRFNALGNQKVTVIETMVIDQAQTIENITTLGQNYDLLIVGHTQRPISNAMTEWRLDP